MSKNETRATQDMKQTRGEILGRELRVASNGLSDERRQQLRSVAMALIHGGKGKPIAVRS